MIAHLFKLAPDYRERVWGGPRLTGAARAAGGETDVIGEAWLAFDGSTVVDGPLAGRTLADLVAADGERLLGASAYIRSRRRMPLLIKLLDTADWLSVQVHPDDEQARRMVGPDEFGKTEAWYFLDAAPKARILAGVRPGTTRERAIESIRDGTVLEVAAELPVEAGDAVLIPAGMLHALGPGLLAYEVQQHSDTTYRAYDWGRPATAGRKLHVEECAAVLQPIEAHAEHAAPPSVTGSCTTEILGSAFFCVASFLVEPGEPLQVDTGGVFAVVTAVEGEAVVRAGDEEVRLGRFESAFVSADAGRYELRSTTEAVLLRSTVPAEVTA